MAKTVNLDAMIMREDFAVEDSNPYPNIQATISINDLQGDFLSSVIRKPDFQRETRDWNIENVVRFIESVVKGQFIPSLILWKNSGGYIFVIDGAHRLSALIAWMKDDYGDGPISRSFFKGFISDEQKKTAESLRKRINKEIGPYSDYEKALNIADGYSAEFVNRARNLRSFAFSIQWISGNVETAEESFYNINQRAVSINDTELKLIQSRKCDNCIAARAVMYSGNGNKYWKEFTEEKQNEIVSLAKQINSLLFEPRYDKPIKTLDLPMCGKNQSNLSFIFDLINFSVSSNLNEDSNGDLTIKRLRETKDLLETVSSKTPGSLGLHPIIYFYSKKGNFRVSAFFAILGFVKHIKAQKKMNDFTSVRGDFESFIYRYDYVVDQINRSLRTTKKSVPVLTQFYIDVLEYLKAGNDFDSIISLLSNSQNYPKFLLDQDEEVVNTEFSANKKSEVFIKQASSSALKCPICGGLLHVNSISIDHIHRKEDGGTGEATNGQATHFYCNTTYKN